MIILLVPMQGYAKIRSHDFKKEHKTNNQATARQHYHKRTEEPFHTPHILLNLPLADSGAPHTHVSGSSP